MSDSVLLPLLRPVLYLAAGLVLALLAGQFVWSAGPVDVYDFPNPELEARYRSLIDEFRCPKCLNTNLSGSDAPIAKDLRGTVHRLLVEEGMSDQQVRDYLQARYGDFVLYKPPLKPGTWPLWGAPVLFALIGIWVIYRVVIRPRPDLTLSRIEQARVRELLDERNA